MKTKVVEKCFSEKDGETLFLIGNDKEGWRKFYTGNEYGGDIYLACLNCDKIKRKNKEKTPIARAILRNGKKLIMTQPQHIDTCEPSINSIMEAEQIDRNKRKDDIVVINSLMAKLRRTWLNQKTIFSSIFSTIDYPKIDIFIAKIHHHQTWT